MSKPGAPRERPLGACLSDVVRPALAMRGMSETSLIAHWKEIVGEAVAKFAQPEQLQWPPRGNKRDPEGPSAPATLVLRIDGAFALEASHMSATIVGRVNAHLGWRCVERIAFRQGPLPPPKRSRRRPRRRASRALARARTRFTRTVVRRARIIDKRKAGRGWRECKRGH